MSAGCCHHRWMCHVVNLRWPTSGTVEGYVINFMDTIKYHTERPDIYLIFEGTSETVQSKIRNPVDQAMMLVESINSAFTQHFPPKRGSQRTAQQGTAY